MMRQYLRIKSQYPDAILFFRMGDFYEMFFEDAEIASRELEIALTSRDKGQEDSVPLCGIPWHSSQPYISKLIRKGYKVAVCEQVEDPKGAKGLVKREVIRVLSPGLIDDPETLEARENNFLMSLAQGRKGFGLGFLDLSTGEFKICQVANFDIVLEEAIRNKPKEMLIPEGFRSTRWHNRFGDTFKTTLFNYLPDSVFGFKQAKALITKQLGEDASTSLFKNDIPNAISAAGAIISYVTENQRINLGHIHSILIYRVGDYMILDDVAKRNLELTQTVMWGQKKGSLLGLLDKTMTPMGGRRLRNWVNYPLLDLRRIRERLEGVSELKEKKIERRELRECLKQVFDLERLISRISMGSANARDLVGLKRSIDCLPRIKDLMKGFEGGILAGMEGEVDTLTDVAQLIGRSIVDNPPLSLREGGIIKDEYHPELDELRSIKRDGKQWIAHLEAEEKSKTGINFLKVRFNQVFGYYIEVTKSNLSLVPDYYIRKQTLSNAERFITPQLKEYESKILSAEERINRLEYDLFQEVRQGISDQAHRVQHTASAIATLDALITLAEVADCSDYVMPVVNDGDEIVIIDGRHPVIESLNLGERFVPNDVKLDCDENQLIIVTGPNMAGKSTYLRQVALIVLMAQIGSFVPAREATIGLVDRIFTRVGAFDNLAQGKSTFMIEMIETANILDNATPRSLIILDEIGRGTSTFDGVSIAWAVAEYIHDYPKLGAKTLFATHYHELTELAMTKEKVKNYNFAVREWNDEVVFLRKIMEGATNRSYGIQVARLAGLPKQLLDRAREILKNLESSELDEIGMPKIAKGKTRVSSRRATQLNLFQAREDLLRKELLTIDIENMTPIEALMTLQELKTKAEK
ncbi:MAG: DNA mismatch repair protein MutS [Syntrophobacterales bacterium]|nr:MAG: DNA mismatch repair protein MutS [Syntrophobacterales bacterium]